MPSAVSAVKSGASSPSCRASITSAEDLARTSHAHPTFAEAVREAALAAGGRAIHQ